MIYSGAENRIPSCKDLNTFALLSTGKTFRDEILYVLLRPTKSWCSEGQIMHLSEVTHWMETLVQGSTLKEHFTWKAHTSVMCFPSLRTREKEEGKALSICQLTRKKRRESERTRIQPPPREGEEGKKRIRENNAFEARKVGSLDRERWYSLR